MGMTFYCGGRKWRCTDIGTRTVIAICASGVELVMGPSDPRPSCLTLNESEAEAAGWFKGPPYKIVETVFDEYDLPGCSLEIEEPPARSIEEALTM